MTPADREEAAKRAAKLGLLPGVAGATGPAVLTPGAVPHYFGPFANYANSPLPTGAVVDIAVENGGSGYTAPVVTVWDVYGTGSGATATATVSGGVITGITVVDGGAGYSAPIAVIEDPTGTDAAASAAIGGTLSGGLRKFVDSVPGLCGTPGGTSGLGNCIPVAVPDAVTFSGEDADYYEIELREYFQQMHPDLPPTRVRGYVQVHAGLDVAPIHYLGPIIVAQRNRPVRIKFTNKLPTGEEGNLFIPVDTTVMGAGMGPLGMAAMPMNYTQNRATLHLHGGFVPWISDGTPHQWTTPAGEMTPYPQGVSVYNVPDMQDPGPNPPQGTLTFYYNNQQSARLQFYHDHSYGITRLNVYAGEAAGYLITDEVEKDLIDGTNTTGVNPDLVQALPGLGMPLVIQDRTFVDAATIAAQDPTWAWGLDAAGNAVTGSLWMPHVYMPAQNPYDPGGANAFGRWHYGPWFWPPTNDIAHPPVANEYFDPACDPGATWCEPPLRPDTPNPSMAMEAFMDTPIVNGAAYPYLEVDPKTYRFRVLNAANDRFFNLQLYVADPAVTTSDGRLNTEVKMVPAIKTAGFPAAWPTDGREGGVPDPATAGPPFIQLGTEGGFLPAPAVVPNQPIGWNLNPTTFNFGNVDKHALLLGAAERADVLVDFSAFAGKTLILYNDAPAAFPARDPRYDYYTGNEDQTDSGGTPPTQPGFGPNTRTVMQIRVRDVAPAAPYDLAALRAIFAKTAAKRGVFEVSQDPILVPQAGYGSAYDGAFSANAFVRIQDNSMSFATLAGVSMTLPLEPKAIQDEMGEAFDTEYGRMSGKLGLELPFTAAGRQNFVLYGYASPPVEILTDSMTPMSPVLGDGTQIWKITHNGVDTHPIHFHLFNVQLINRVAWDGAIMAPDPNELGWKETVRVNPLEDTIVAMRPYAPTQPFELPNSVRLIDPTMPEGAVLATGGPVFDPSAQQVTLTNHYVNYGFEYVYHCHILGHEEMDMMHAMIFAVAPRAPTGLTVFEFDTATGREVTLNWVDTSLNESGFTIQRAPDESFSAGLTTFSVGADVTTYTDTTAVNGLPFFYRVLATNLVGDAQAYPAPSIGFPHKAVDSAPTNTVSVSGAPGPNAPSNLVATLRAGPRVYLQWTDNSEDETGFLVERAVGGGPFTLLARVGRRSGTFMGSYLDTSPVPDNIYTYRVSAVNLAGTSAWTNTAVVEVRLPAAPTNLTAIATAGRLAARVTLVWTDNADNETGFRIQWATDPAFTTGLVTRNVTADRVSFIAGSLPFGTDLYFRVRAHNLAGPSAWVEAVPFPVTTP